MESNNFMIECASINRKAKGKKNAAQSFPVLDQTTSLPGATPPGPSHSSCFFMNLCIQKNHLMIITIFNIFNLICRYSRNHSFEDRIQQKSLFLSSEFKSHVNCYIHVLHFMTFIFVLLFMLYTCPFALAKLAIEIY